MGKKEKEKLLKFNSPGPGKYNLDKLITFTHSPTWKMGTGSKIMKLRVDTNIPGSGIYNVGDKPASGEILDLEVEKEDF